ncbi:MAG: hypothetical protein JXD22_10550, partial [Sedimentisphaerales bacterium]|nr:hypothetical protein [Sedimentisphaerales bacterium]
DFYYIAGSSRDFQRSASLPEQTFDAGVLIINPIIKLPHSGSPIQAPPFRLPHSGSPNQAQTLRPWQ